MCSFDNLCNRTSELIIIASKRSFKRWTAVTEEIFYLQSRCVDRDQAKLMLAQGFIDDVLNTVDADDIRDKLKVENLRVE